MSAFDDLHRELRQLGLDPATFPGNGFAADAEALDALLDRVRTLAPPATWRDVFPDIPTHWVEGRPETWTTNYKPLGPYDHPSLPTGPAIHVHWPRSTDHRRLDRFVEAARAEGWPIYGAGVIETTNPDWPTIDAMIVLDAGTSRARLDDFLDWLSRRGDATLAAVSRRGDERDP